MAGSNLFRGFNQKPQREKLYHVSVLRKQASFEKIKTVLPNKRSNVDSPFCIYIRMMTNTFLLECYHQLVMCQSPAPEVEVVWTIPQRKTHKLELVSTQACEQTTGDKTFLVDERKIGSCHFPSKRRKIAGIFP